MVLLVINEDVLQVHGIIHTHSSSQFRVKQILVTMYADFRTVQNSFVIHTSLSLSRKLSFCTKCLKTLFVIVVMI